MARSTPNREDLQSAIGFAVEQIVKQVREGGIKHEHNQNDDEEDTNDWAEDEEAYDDAIRQIESVDLTQDDDDEASSHSAIDGETDETLRCDHSGKGIRNSCLCGTHDLVSAHSKGEVQVVDGKVYALDSDHRVGRYLVDFIDVKQIWRHKKNDSVIIRGAAYARTRNLDGRLEAYKSEVCRMMEIDSNDLRKEEDQSMIEAAIDDLRPQPRILHLTNKQFPECRFDPESFVTQQEREELAPLTCRWFFAMIYPDKRFRHAQRPIDGELLAHHTEVHVHKQRHRASDAERLFTWRGETKKGGSHESPTETTVLNVQGKKVLVSRRRYNAADMFSGAGGYTTGAKSAGIKVERAVDHWVRCNATYQANHPEVELYAQDIMVHCNDLTIAKVRFDLVHLSPPCQTFSPAHTCPGKNDSANIAALSACQYIVYNFRPRIITFEQTFGIIQERHLPLFNALVQSLTKYGYSLKWKVIRLVDYGLPQTRKRLIMIGAAPGEKLPPFPTPTHTAQPVLGDGKRRYVSAVKACWGLVDGINMHNPTGVKQVERVQWDGTQPMNRTITTSGGQAYHWEGQRDLTLAEFARLQGFPEDYVFKAPCIKKQIGNAFPPVVVRAIMKQLVSWLEGVDGINVDPSEQDIIAIDDDDEDDDNDGQHDGGQQKHGDLDGDNPGGDYLAHKPNLFAHEFPDGYSMQVEDVDSEAETMTAALHESMELAAFQNQGVYPVGYDVSASSYGAPSPLPNTAADVLAMNSAQRASWAAQLAQQGNIPRRSSSRSSRRRRSSGGSSLIYTGQRQLATIIEDDEDDTGESSSTTLGCGNGAPSSAVVRSTQNNRGQDSTLVVQTIQDEEDEGSGSSSGNFDDVDNQRYEDIDQYECENDGTPLLYDPPSPPSRPSALGPSMHGRDPAQALGLQGTTYGGVRSFAGATRFSANELASMDDDEMAGVLGMRDEDDDFDDHSGAAAPPDSFTGGQHASDNALGSVPDSSQWSVRHQAGASARDQDQAGSSSHIQPSFSGHLSRPGSYFDPTQWQGADVGEDDALARAMETSIQDAFQRHEQVEEHGSVNTVISAASSGSDVTDAFLAPAVRSCFASKPQEETTYKEKGKAVAKRSYDGAADDFENGSASKKSRTE